MFKYWICHCNCWGLLNKIIELRYVLVLFSPISIFVSINDFCLLRINSAFIYKSTSFVCQFLTFDMNQWILICSLVFFFLPSPTSHYLNFIRIKKINNIYITQPFVVGLVSWSVVGKSRISSCCWWTSSQKKRRSSSTFLLEYVRHAFTPQIKNIDMICPWV